MAFNISEFSANLNKHGLAQNNLFLVRITGGPVTRLLNKTESNMKEQDLVFFCRSADLPGFQIQTQDYLPQGFGTPDRRPANMPLQPLNTVFMVDSKFAIMKFFHRWVQSIVNYDKSSILGEVDDALPYEIGYKEDYACTIEVVVYSTAVQDFTYTYRMTGAYPVTLGNVSTAWENSAEIMVLPVTFTYDTLEVDGQEKGTVGKRNSRGNGLLSYLSAANSIIQAIDQIKRPRNIQDLINTTNSIKTITNALGL